MDPLKTEGHSVGYELDISIDKLWSIKRGPDSVNPRSRNAQPLSFSKLQMTLTWQALTAAVWQHLPCWSKQEQPLHTSWSSDRSQG